MSVEKTERHEIVRGTGKIAVEITYTPRTGKPLRTYRLKMRVVSAEGCSKYVFVYHRAAAGAPMEDGSPRDEFTCVADLLDEDEIPTEEYGPDMERGIPYYRSDEVELLFRSYDEMYATSASLVYSLSV